MTQYKKALRSNMPYFCTKLGDNLSYTLSGKLKKDNIIFNRIKE